VWQKHPAGAGTALFLTADFRHHRQQRSGLKITLQQAAGNALAIVVQTDVFTNPKTWVLKFFQ
jgi:hypothetical protein